MSDPGDPTRIPILPLKIITATYILWFVVFPVVLFIRQGRLSDIPLTIALGLTLVGVGLGTLFIHRLFLWFYYTFFWYILAALAVGSAFCAATLAVGVFTLPTIPSSSAIPVPLQALFIPGAIIGVIALVLVFRTGGKPIAVKSIQTAPTPAPVAKPPAGPSPDELLKERRKKLGLDK